MSTPYSITITTGSGTATAHTITALTTIGRSDADIIVPEGSISRQHLTIEPRDEYCVVTDLQSSNGTFINNSRIDVPTQARPGDVVRLGQSVTLTVATLAPVKPQARASTTTTATLVQPMVAGPGVPDGMSSVERDGIEVRFIEKSAGRKAAKSMLDSARRARKKLAGFGSEPDGTKVIIHLIDPIERDGTLITAGSIVDAGSGQVWCVVTPDSPPEDPTRAMALIFGAGFPAATELEALIAGYGLEQAGFHDAAPGDWTDLAEPAATQTAAAFVHHLLEQSDDATVRDFLASPPEQIDARARQLFGKPLEQILRSWIADDASDYKAGQFMRLAFRRLWPYRIRQVEVFVYMLLSLAFTSVYPFVTRHLFDEVIPSQEFSRVWKLLLLLAGAFLVSLLAGVRRSIQSSYISNAVVRDIRQEMFDRAQKLSASSMSGYQQGEVLSRMFQDVGRLQAGLSAMINTGIFQMVTLVVSGIIMLSVNLWLGLLVVVGAPIIAIVYRQMGEGAQKRSIAMQEDGAALMTVASENYQAGPVVKLFRLEGRESARFGEASDRLIESAQRMAVFNGMFGLSVNFIMTLLQMSVLGIGAWLIFEGQFTLGGLVAFLGVMGEFLGPVTELTTLGQTMQTSMGSLKRVEEVTNAEVEPAGEDLPDLEPLSHSIELRDLSFSYTPERRTLDGLNVTIPAGKRTAFVGPSGSGKSTVLQILMRLIEPDEGALLIDGADVRERSLSSLRRQTGVVFQDPFLFNISLAENIALGGDHPTPEQVHAAASAAEIDSFVAQLADGLHSNVGEGGSMLSGGQRQRAAIARALVANPSMLILDEATSALDAATERQINDTIERAVHGRTVISVTHRLTSITDYDHIVVLVDGAIESQGTHAQLLSEGGMYARLWSEQTGLPLPEKPAFDPVEALIDLPVFRAVDPTRLRELAAAGRTVRFGTGATATSPEGGLAVILDGQAELTNPAGAVVIAGVGHVIGSAALLGFTESTTIRATEPIELLMIDSEHIAPFLLQHATATATTETLVLPASSKTLVRAAISGSGTPGTMQPTMVADVRATMRMAAPRSET
nr:hypothetical protein [uncultured bacterium]